MTAATELVLGLVREERKAQDARYGHVNGRLLSGTGPEARWLLPYTSDFAQAVQRTLRADYEDFETDAGLPTWLHLVREEIAEAFQESDPARLAEELVQVAALCVSWVERLEAVNCQECGNDAGPYLLEQQRLCLDCLEAAFNPEGAL